MGILSGSAKKYYLPDITGYIKATLESGISNPVEVELKSGFSEMQTSRKINYPVIAVKVSDYITWSKFNGGAESAKPNDFILIDIKNPGNSVAVTMNEYLIQYKATEGQNKVDVLQMALDSVESNKTAESILYSQQKEDKPINIDDIEL